MSTLSPAELALQKLTQNNDPGATPQMSPEPTKDDAVAPKSTDNNSERQFVLINGYQTCAPLISAAIKSGSEYSMADVLGRLLQLAKDINSKMLKKIDVENTSKAAINRMHAIVIHAISEAVSGGNFDEINHADFAEKVCLILSEDGFNAEPPTYETNTTLDMLTIILGKIVPLLSSQESFKETLHRYILSIDSNVKLAINTIQQNLPNIDAEAMHFYLKKACVSILVANYDDEKQYRTVRRVQSDGANMKDIHDVVIRKTKVNMESLTEALLINMEP